MNNFGELFMTGQSKYIHLIPEPFNGKQATLVPTTPLLIEVICKAIQEKGQQGKAGPAQGQRLQACETLSGFKRYLEGVLNLGFNLLRSECMYGTVLHPPYIFFNDFQCCFP